MLIDVTVLPAEDESAVPDGTPVHIEVRDVSLQDVAASVVAVADTTSVSSDPAGKASGGRVPRWSASATLEIPDDLPPGADITVWARVAASGSERTAAGDSITVQSFPLPAPGSADMVTVTVKEI